jgi:hypothetical protein
MNMKHLARTAACCLALLFTGAAFAAGASDASLQRLMELSGTTTQIGQLPGQVQAGLAQSQRQEGGLTDRQFADLSAAVVGAIDPAPILATLRASLAQRLSEAEVRELLAWYESDLGRRITRAEVDAADPAALQTMIANAEKLLANQQRVEQALELDRLMKATDQAAMLQEKLAVAMFVAIATLHSGGQPVDTEAFLAQMRQHQQQIRANVQQFIVLAYVFSYRDIGMAELKRYHGFLAQPTSAKMVNAINDGMSRGLDAMIDQIALAVAALFDQEMKRQSL